jgi:hypothetical protein
VCEVALTLGSPHSLTQHDVVSLLLLFVSSSNVVATVFFIIESNNGTEIYEGI